MYRVGKDRIYLDHNATSPLRPEVTQRLRSLVGVGNPSSVHQEGRAARALVEMARAQVAAFAGMVPEGVVFTSGGSEANAMALRPGALRCRDGRPVRRLLVGATEHPSVRDGQDFGENHAEIRVDFGGRIELRDLAARLRASDVPTLVSIQVANSETGVVQPIREIAEIVREAGAVLHTDAVQAAGKRVVLANLPVDAMTLSAHKLGGPMGVGALVVAPERIGPEAALIRGGGQQKGLRAGTENVPAIVGFGLACELAARDLAKEADRLVALRDAAERGVRRAAADAVIFGAGACRLPNTLAFAVPGLRAETALIALDLAGIAVSSGSACSSGKVGKSHVLAAMGVADGLREGALRVSFGWNSTDRDVERFLEAFASLTQRLHERRPPRAA